MPIKRLCFRRCKKEVSSVLKLVTEDFIGEYVILLLFSPVQFYYSGMNRIISI